jgi:hypothetical protein
MSWQVRDDVLVLTSKDVADKLFETRVYQLAPPVDFDQLIERVVKVRPATWAEDGGDGLVKQLAPNVLIVYQTHAIQSELTAQFADVLRPVAHAFIKSPQLASPAQARALGLPATCNFDQKPLEDVLKSLSRESKLPLTLDKNALDNEGLAADMPITCTLRGAKLATVLTLLLDPLELTYVLEKRGLRITTRAQAETDLLTVSYPAADLVTDGEGTELMNAVNTTVAPTTWSVVNGDGEVEFQPGSGLLEVKQTFEVQRQVEQLLADIRAARSP